MFFPVIRRERERRHRLRRVGVSGAAVLAIGLALPGPAGANEGGGHHGGGSGHAGWHGGHDHNHHFRGGHFGFGVWWPDYDWAGYYSSYYADPAAAGYPATSYWYYCQNPAGYYPYVAQCAVPWQPVPIVPPS